MDSLVEVEQVRGVSQLVSCRSVAPLRIIQTSGKDGVRAAMSSYGGGMVQGDRIDLRIRCGSGSALFLTTQANTQIYENSGGPPVCQSIRGCLGKGARAEILPLANVMHRSARFMQDQQWDLAADADLILAEIFQAGRIENGERFEFDEYASRLIIRREGHLVCEEAACFQPFLHDQTNPARFGPYNILLNLYIIGPRAETVVSRLREIHNKTAAFSFKGLPQTLPAICSALHELPAPQAFVCRAMARKQLELREFLAAVGLDA